MRLQRENPWIREWEGDFGTVVDSKFRTFDCDPSASVFIEAWKAADQPERQNMEIAFAYFPKNRDADRNQILDRLGTQNAAIAQRFKNAWESAAEMSELQMKFQKDLIVYAQESGAPRVRVGDNNWFSVDKMISGILLVHKQFKPAPTEADFDALLAIAADSSNDACYYGIEMARNFAEFW